jgi:hypothetical protein
MILREYRQGDIKALGRYAEPHTADLEARVSADPAWTLEDDGSPVACGGVVTLIPGVGEIWLVVSPLMTVRPLSLCRALRAKKRELLSDKYGYRRLQAIIWCGFELGCRLATRYGLTYEGTLERYLPYGDAYMFAVVREDK